MPIRWEQGIVPEIVIYWGKKDGWTVEKAFQFVPYNSQSCIPLYMTDVYVGWENDRFGSMNTQRYDIQKVENIVNAMRPCLSKSILEVRETVFNELTISG